MTKVKGTDLDETTEGQLDGFIAGDPGLEGAGITIRGVVYDSELKVSELGGVRQADLILHRHSTTVPVTVIGSRSNSDTSAHAAVTTGQSLIDITGAGWDGTDYEISSRIQFVVDGTVGSNDVPGRIEFSTATAGTITERLRINQNGAFGIGGANFGTSGQVIVSAGSAAAPAWGQLGTAGISDDSVTYAKMQNISATDKILGRSTAGAGDIEEITCTPAGRALLDDADVVAQRTTLSVPEIITADRTYYVRTDGNDSNTGLVDSAGGAFLTIQKAVDTVVGLVGSYVVTIQVRSGTYNVTSIALKPHNIASVVIVGDTTTPSNVLINASNAGFFYQGGRGAGPYAIKGFKIVATNYGLRAGYGAYISFGNINFGACGDHIFCEGGYIEKETNAYEISGNATRHINCINGGVVAIQNLTVTIGTALAFTRYCDATKSSTINAFSITFTGAGVAGTTGTRYLVNTNAVIDTGGGGANYFPGNVAGSSATGGQYV